MINNQWKEIAKGTTIGSKRILRFNPVKTDRLKIYFTGVAVPVVLSEIAVYP
jgi:alpha-L-fucosidase